MQEDRFLASEINRSEDMDSVKSDYQLRTEGSCHYAENYAFHRLHEPLSSEGNIILCRFSHQTVE